VPRIVKMGATLAFAAVMAGLSAICLGLVDAGQEIDATLSRLEYDAASLNRAAGGVVEHRTSADLMTPPSSRLRHALDSLDENVTRIISEKAPSYGRPVAGSLAAALDLVPRKGDIDLALQDYLQEIKQASAETSRTEAAVELRSRMLDFKYERFVQRISEARGRTRQGLNTALTGLQFVTLISIGVAALLVGLSGD
jgi:hypothetical protein